jgi:hypothetical protein
VSFFDFSPKPLFQKLFLYIRLKIKE